MRKAYLKTLYNLALKDDNVVSLVADNGLIVFDNFRESFADRYFNFGISEENMIGAAAGMANCGKIPFCYTISSFLAYRSFEFIRDDVCFQNQNVKIVGIGSGMAYSTLGPSHHTTEDISVLRALPNLTLFSPGSPLDVEKIIKTAYQINGPVYVRLGTNNEREIYKDDYDFKLGKAEVIREGIDITVFVTGSIISEVIDAAEMLENDKISVRIVNVHTLKPFDNEQVLESAAKTKHLFTVEEHSILGGLGSIVAEALADNGVGAKLKRIGLNNKFAGGYGTYNEVRQANGLDKNGIYSAIKDALK